MSKIEMGKKYRTRSGELVRVLCTDRPTAGFLKVVAVTSNGVLICADSSGNSSNGRPYDLVEVKPRIKRELWVNVYPFSEISSDGSVTVRGSRELCDKYATDDRIACVKVVVDCEEGEGLS